MLSVLAIRRFTGLLEKLNGSTFCCLRIAASFMGTSQLACSCSPTMLNIRLVLLSDGYMLFRYAEEERIYDTVTSQAVITDSARAMHPRACVY